MQHTADNQCAVTQSMQVAKRLRTFTLVELLIVVVILGILATVVIPSFSKAATETKSAMLKNHLRLVRSQLQVRELQTGLPSAALFEKHMTAKLNDMQSGKSLGPWLNRIPVNPFNGKETVEDQADAGYTANDDSHGWAFNETNGKFVADDSDSGGGDQW